jgi:Predicted membrane protein
MAIGSGVLIGLFYIFIDLAPDSSGITPLVANRILQFTLVGLILLVVVLAKGRGFLIKPSGDPWPWSRVVWVLVAGGILDALSNIPVLTGFRVGEVTLVAVLTALYPAGTILLASLVLHDRIQRLPWVGLGLALVASMLLATSGVLVMKRVLHYTHPGVRLLPGPFFLCVCGCHDAPG